MKEIIADHIGDLGGADSVSASERNLVRRAAVMTIECERMEQRFALSDAADPDEIELYTRVVGHLRRVLEGLGLARRPRMVGGNVVANMLKPQPSELDAFLSTRYPADRTIEGLEPAQVDKDDVEP